MKTYKKELNEINRWLNKNGYPSIWFDRDNERIKVGLPDHGSDKIDIEYFFHFKEDSDEIGAWKINAIKNGQIFFQYRAKKLTVQRIRMIHKIIGIMS